jgi:pSer/pThr/pTyr-binding forkhead associated (FHA) protein
MFRLQLTFPKATVRGYTLKNGDILFIGRNPESHIVTDDPQVSRRHACIGQLGDKLFVWDEASKHGTSVNGIPVICGRLSQGDVVSIGANHNLKASITIRVKQHEDTVAAIINSKQKLSETI